MAKPRPARTDTFINHVLQTFYDCHTSDLPITFTLPEGVEPKAFVSILWHRLFVDKEFSKKLFKIGRKGDTIYIDLKN